MRKLFESLLPLLQLLEMLKERASNFHDKVVEARNLAIDDQSGTLLIRNGSTESYDWQPQAFSLVCSKLRTPASFMERCPTWLRAQNMNTFLRRDPDREFLVRLDGTEARAILSPRYKPVSNVSLVEALYSELGNVILRAEVDPLQMILQVVTDRGQEISPGDRVHGGCQVGNSEVGFRCIGVQSWALRVLCLNGLLLGGQAMTYKRKHLTDPDQVLSDFRKAVAEAAEAGASVPSQLGDLRYIKISNHERVLERIQERYKLQPEEMEAVWRAWPSEAGDSLFHVVGAITRAGNDRSLDVESSARMQELGGRILTLASRGERWVD